MEINELDIGGSHIFENKENIINLPGELVWSDGVRIIRDGFLPVNLVKENRVVRSFKLATFSYVDTTSGVPAYLSMSSQVIPDYMIYFVGMQREIVHQGALSRLNQGYSIIGLTPEITSQPIMRMGLAHEMGHAVLTDSAVAYNLLKAVANPNDNFLPNLPGMDKYFYALWPYQTKVAALFSAYDIDDDSALQIGRILDIMLERYAWPLGVAAMSNFPGMVDVFSTQQQIQYALANLDTYAQGFGDMRYSQGVLEGDSFPLIMDEVLSLYL